MIDQLGPVPLFLGVETLGWQLSTFTDATNKAKALGVTSLLVKIADGGNQWYGALGGWQKVLDTISKAGLKAVPYTYSYGNTYGAMQAEISILASAMQYAGIVIADMEKEWNGQAIWAHQFSDALRSVQGLFGVTTWGDPLQQNWASVITALKPCVDFWMPQVYSDFLASVYQAQYAPYGIPVIPALNLGTDFGANDIVTIAQAATSEQIALWWYGPAISTYAQTVQAIVKMKGSSMLVPQGWKDDGTTLTAPNSVPVVQGFRSHILQSPNWDAGNVPQAPEMAANPVQYHNVALGGGTVQAFRDCVLWWTSAQGVVQEPYSGLEIWACYQKISQLEQQLPPPVTTATDAVNTLKSVRAIIDGAINKLSS